MVTGLGAIEVVEAIELVVEAGVVPVVDDVAPVEASQDTTASAAEIAIGSRKGLRIG